MSPENESTTFTVEQELSHVAGFVNEAADSYHQEVEGTIQALAEVLSAVAKKAHALPEPDRSSTESQDDTDTSPSDHALILGYRRAMFRQVVEPLKSALDGEAGGRRILDSWVQFCSTLKGSVDGLPRALVRDEPNGLYQPQKGDSSVRRGGMASVRLWRGLAHGLGAPYRLVTGNAPATRKQRVPFRALSRFHLLARVPRLYSRYTEVVVEAFAKPTATLETTLDEWLHDTLALESEAADNRGQSSEREDEDESSGQSVADRLDHIHATFLARVGALSESLDLLRQTATPPDLSLANRAFELECQRAGTFMVDTSARSSSAVSRVRVYVDERWRTYFERVSARFTLATTLNDFRDEIQSLTEDLAQGLSDSTESDRRALRAAAETLRQQIGATGQGNLDAEAILAEKTEALKAVHDLVGRRSSMGGASQAYRATDSAADRLGRLVGNLPDRIITQETQDGSSYVASNPPQREHRLRELGRQAYDVVSVDHVRSTAQVSEAYEALRRGLGDVEEVLRFNLGSAREEATEEGGDEQAARELLDGGLERSAVQLETLALGLEEAVSAQTDSVTSALERPWKRFHQRVRGDAQTRDELIGIWHQVIDAGKEGYRAYRERLEAADQRLRAWLSGLSKRFLRLVRLGQVVVLQEHTSEAETERTLRAIQDVDELRASFPVVYGRLFSGEPLKDPQFTVGRTNGLARIRHLRRRWERGVAPLVAITAEPGAGKSTFLNLLERDVFSDVTCLRIRLGKRLGSVLDVLEHIRQAMPADRAPEAFPAESSPVDAMNQLFDSLAALAGQSKVAVMIDDVEHLLERRVGGADVMRELLTQLRRSPPNIWWVLSSAPYGWGLLEVLEPSASTLVSRLDLSLLDRDELEAAVITRHQRSGLPVEYKAPEAPSGRLRRDLGRATSNADRQDVLRGAFFDELHRDSAGDLNVAMFSWLRLLELNRDDHILTVLPFRALSFGFLSNLRLEQSFALKSLLDHRTLTPREHSRIRNQELAESLLIFETLLGLRLITPSVEQDETGVPAMEDHRYLIHPLVTRAVRDHLRGRHILH